MNDNTVGPPYSGWPQAPPRPATAVVRLYDVLLVLVAALAVMAY
jgi:hypothetical protein